MITEFGKTKAYVFGALSPLLGASFYTQRKRFATCEPMSPYNQGKSHGQLEMRAGEPLQLREVTQTTQEENEVSKSMFARETLSSL